MSATAAWILRISGFLLGLGSLGWWVGCGEGTYTGGRCGDTPDCRSNDNHIPGTECVESWCECLSGMDKCCPEGDNANCKASGDFRCRPYSECHPDMPLVECTETADCGAPPDAQCGGVRCVSGKCEFDIKLPSPALPSQVPGDCQTSFCDIAGRVVLMKDSSDQPLDGEPCTVDLCGDGAPAPYVIDDGIPCPGLDSGVCYQGKCVECMDNDVGGCGGTSAPFCDNFVCVPQTCIDGALNGSESDYDCGGSQCQRCSPGQTCEGASDCRSSVCLGGKCQGATHNDGVKNGDETGKDCGCAECPLKCQDGDGCKSPNDCLSGVCYGGFCLKPTCLDGTRNGGELGPDCGGPCALSCSK